MPRGNLAVNIPAREDRSGHMECRRPISAACLLVKARGLLHSLPEYAEDGKQVKGCLNRPSSRSLSP